MSLLWEILVGLLWQFDYLFNQLADSIPLAGDIAIGIIAAALGLWSAWHLGGKEAQSAANCLILVCALDTPVLLLGAGEPLLAWSLCLPVCALAVWAGNAPQPAQRWAARAAWTFAFLAPAIMLENGASAALIISLFAWTVGWGVRKTNINGQSWIPGLQHNASSKVASKHTQPQTDTIKV